MRSSPRTKLPPPAGYGPVATIRKGRGRSTRPPRATPEHDLAVLCNVTFCTHPLMQALRGQGSASGKFLSKGAAGWAYLEAEGVRVGAADFVVLDKGTAGQSGLHLEFKAPGAPGPRRNQLAYHVELRARDHMVAIVRTEAQFVKAVLDYCYGEVDAQGNRPTTVLFNDRPKASESPPGPTCPRPRPHTHPPHPHP
jgi:hypothetical protein